MSLIDIKPDALRDKADQLETLRESDMETLKQIRILIYGLEESWRGHSADVFFDQFREKEPDLSEFYNSLKEFIDTLNDIANGAGQLDATLYQRVSNISDS